MALGRPLIVLLALVSLVLVACSGSTSDEPTSQPQAATEATTVLESPPSESTVVPAETRGPAPTISAPLAATAEIETATPTLFIPMPTPTVLPTATEPAAQCTVSGPPAELSWGGHLPNTYLLASVAVGNYNLSYRGYEAWLRDHWEITSDEGAALNRHVVQQAIVAISDPDSTIGFTLRAIEQACDSLESGLGTRVWWDYLLAPLHSRISVGTYARQSAEGYFIQAFSDYQAARISNPRLVSLGDFLTTTGYLDRLEARLNPEQSPSSTPSPRPSPTQVAESVPNEGSILYDRPLSEWRTEQWQNGWAEATSTSLHIGVYATDERHIIESWTDSRDFANISASVEVREVSNGAAAMACLSIRHDITDGDYSFCIHGDGSTRAIHNYVDANGVWQVEELLGYAARGGTGVVTGDTLEIIADGNRLTFKVNGMVHGTVTHNARTIGGVALAVRSVDAVQDAEFEFRNLVIRGVN